MYTKDDVQNKKKPTTARDASQPSQRKSRRENRGASESADWANASAEQLHKAVAKLTARGCAVQFGYTRDGGSFSIRIVGDGEPYNEYVRPTESIDEYLIGLANDFEG